MINGLNPNRIQSPETHMGKWLSYFPLDLRHLSANLMFSRLNRC